MTPLLTLLAGLAPQPLAAPLAGDAVVVQATMVHTADAAIENGRVVIRDGRIEAVGPDVGAGERLIEVEGHLTAGMVVLGDRTSLGAEARDETRQVMDTADLVHGYDAESKDWAPFLEAGVTAVLLTPEAGALVGGRTAVVKPGGAVMSPRAHLDLCFSTAAFRDGVAPSSYPGALAMLEEHMAGGAGGFGLIKDGLPVHLSARTRAEGLRAIAFAQRHGLKGALSGVARAGDLAPELKEAGLAVILPPLGPGSDPRHAASAAALAKAGVPMGFSLDAKKASPTALRFTAAQCMKAGMPRAAAWSALTSQAGAISGTTAGSLAPGSAADLVLWSGDPLDLTSRVERVWIDGAAVHGGDDQ